VSDPIIQVRLYKLQQPFLNLKQYTKISSLDKETKFL